MCAIVHCVFRLVSLHYHFVTSSEAKPVTNDISPLFLDMICFTYNFQLVLLG